MSQKALLSSIPALLPLNILVRDLTTDDSAVQPAPCLLLVAVQLLNAVREFAAVASALFVCWFCNQMEGRLFCDFFRENVI